VGAKIKFAGVLLEDACETFFPVSFLTVSEFLVLSLSRSTGGLLSEREGFDVVGVKVFDKSLSRLETLRSTPPFLQLNFLLRLKMGEYWL